MDKFDRRLDELIKRWWPTPHHVFVFVMVVIVVQWTYPR